MRDIFNTYNFEMKMLFDVDGRDKLYKFIQYFYRYLIFKQIGNMNANQSVFENMGNARKLFRLGKFMLEY